MSFISDKDELIQLVGHSAISLLLFWVKLIHYLQNKSLLVFLKGKVHFSGNDVL